MRAYSYTAFTEAGKRKGGTIVAETEADAAAQLSRQKLFVSEITPARSSRVAGFKLARRVRLATDLQAVFTRQMAVLLGAEMPVEAALEAVRTGGHPALDGVAAQARAEVMDGAPLSEALDRAGAGFAPYYLAALKAGEAAGETAAVFGELADHLEQLGTDKAQISTALVYPGFVAAVSLLVCGILMVNVAPEIVIMFEMSGRPLPVLTENVLAVSDWIRAHWIGVLVGLAGCVTLAALTPRIAGLRDARDRIVLHLPIIGHLTRLAASVQYMRTLALILGSRHAVLDAVDSAVDVLAIRSFRQQGQEVTTAVRQGETLSRALDRLTFLPPIARQLISAGEASVRLAPMTARAAMLVEHRLSTERKRIAALLEPILMMLVGAMVLVIVLAVLLPVFDLQAVVAG